MKQPLLQLAGLSLLAVTLACSYGCGTGNGNGTTRKTITPANFTTIDGPGGSPTTLNGISNGGMVVGFTTNNGANANFLRSTNVAFTSLNIGDPAAGMANGVNNHNAVVGVANNSAFLLANGNQTTLTPPNSTSSIAFGINDSGVVVGQFVAAAGGNTPGFVEVNGAFTTITPTASATITNVQSINNNGMAIGFYSADGVHQHGFLYSTRTNQTKLLPDPSTPRILSGGLTLTQFLGINDNNEAVGYYQISNGSQFGFLFNINTQTYTFLDAPQAAPQISGANAGVQITQITGVADGGEITGFFIDANSVQHGFIATPAGN